MTPIDQLRLMATKDENGLLPCVRCGSKNISYVEGNSYHCDWVTCECEANADSDTWNTRAIDAPALLAEIEKMQDALRFYSRSTAYRSSTVYVDGTSGFTEIEQDMGKRARDCLTKEDE